MEAQKGQTGCCLDLELFYRKFPVSLLKSTPRQTTDVKTEDGKISHSIINVPAVIPISRSFKAFLVFMLSISKILRPLKV